VKLGGSRFVGSVLSTTLLGDSPGCSRVLQGSGFNSWGSHSMASPSLPHVSSKSMVAHMIADFPLGVVLVGYRMSSSRKVSSESLNEQTTKHQHRQQQRQTPEKSVSNTALNAIVSSSSHCSHSIFSLGYLRIT
jgi:hypothetical protein